MTQLHTPHLTLRPARMDDLEAFHAIFTQPEAMRYWSRPVHESRDETRGWLAGMCATAPHEGEDFVIEHQGQLIGKAGFYRFPEIGFIMHPAHWGKGLMGEALDAILSRAFRVHRLEQVIADVDPRNVASMGLLTRNGFIETHRAERTWFVAGEWCDSIYLALDEARLEEARQSRTP